MDINEITTIITTVGFPIVAAAALFWYINKKDERHEAETKALQKSLEENTNVLSELKSLITFLVGELKNDKRD